jgi:hypothetical protein
MWIQSVAGGGVEQLAYAPDGRTLYTRDTSGWITAWDIAARTKKRLFQLAPDKPERYNVGGMFTADAGRYLVVQVIDYARVWDVANNVLLPDLPGGCARGRMKPARSGSAVYCIPTTDPATIASFDLATGQPGPTLDASEPLVDFDFTPGGEQLALLTRGQRVKLLDPVRGQRVNLLDPVTGSRTMLALPNTRFPATKVQVLPDATGLVRVGVSELTIWDFATAAPRCAPVMCHMLSMVFALHPRAPIFAALNANRHPTLYSLQTGEALRSLDLAIRSAFLQCACFSHDGLTCAFGGSNKQFAVFDVDL